MVHYRQGTFHCYIWNCVVSGDKRTTILISVRRKNTWLEPMKSSLSFCHWLGPSGPNKVFLLNQQLLEITQEHSFFPPAVESSMFVLHFSARFDRRSRTEAKYKSFRMHLFVLNVSPLLLLLPLQPSPARGGDRSVGHVSQSVSGWQFYNTCTILMGTITQ